MFFLGIAWIILGSIFISTYWDGLSKWWEIVNMTYVEVKETPYLPIWTSGRGINGIVFVVGGIMFISEGWKRKKKKQSEPAGWPYRENARWLGQSLCARQVTRNVVSK